MRTARPEKVAIQQNARQVGTKAYVIAADTERMEIAVVQWREAEVHNLSNVDAKPLTLPCSVIAHLTKPRCETPTFPSSLSSEGYRVARIHRLSEHGVPSVFHRRALTQRGQDSRLIIPVVELGIFDICDQMALNGGEISDFFGVSLIPKLIFIVVIVNFNYNCL